MFTDSPQLRREPATDGCEALPITQRRYEMQRFRFPIAVAVTSLALVLSLVAVGGLVAGRVLASAQPFGGWHGGPPWAAGQAFGPGLALPPELAGLAEVPADQRFGHFKSAQVHLTDRDGRPVTIDVTPGVATAVSPTSLTITANEGTSKTVSLNEQTI